MMDYTSEQSSLVYRWTFEKLLPALPTPGTKAFAVLCQKLQPHGISPSGISLEAPTALLADVILRINLLDRERVSLRLSYGWFELSFDYLSQGDEAALLEILNGTFDALAEVDPQAGVGRAQIQLNAHFRLETGTVEAFLREHLHGGENHSNLTPAACSYIAELTNEASVSEMSVVVMKSLRFENSLFVGLNTEYGGLRDLELTKEKFGKDCQTTLALIGLNPKTALQEEAVNE